MDKKAMIYVGAAVAVVLLLVYFAGTKKQQEDEPEDGDDNPQDKPEPKAPKAPEAKAEPKPEPKAEPKAEPKPEPKAKKTFKPSGNEAGEVKPGEESDNVAQLQINVNTWLDDGEKVKVTGVYDNNTADALMDVFGLSGNVDLVDVVPQVEEEIEE